VLLDVIHRLTQEEERENTNGGASGSGDSAVKEEDILDPLSYHMGISLDAMEHRLNELREQQKVEEQRQQKVNWEEKYDFDLLDTDFHTAFCRICRKFGCRVHRGSHPRPVMGPMSLAEEKEREKMLQRRLRFQNLRKPATYEELVEEGKEICGEHCYRLLLGAQELEAEAREAAAAAAAVEEEEEEEEEEEDADDEGEEEDEEDEEVVDAEPIQVDNEVINLISEEDDTTMVTANENADGDEEAEKEVADSPLASLTAVLAGNGAGGSGATKSAVVLKQPRTKAQNAARAAAAQAEPPFRRTSPPLPRTTTAAAAAAASVVLFWNCTACTFRNKADATNCEMCETEKPVAVSPSKMDVDEEVIVLDDDDDEAKPSSPPRQATPPGAVATTLVQKTTGQQQQNQAGPSTANLNATNTNNAPWQLWEDAALEKGIEIWGRQPCKIAALVGSRTCSQVRSRMMTLLPSPLPMSLNRRNNSQNGVATGSGGAGAGPSNGQFLNNYSNGGALYDGEQHRRRRKGGRSTNKLPSVVYQRLKRSTDESWPQFHPCGCTGPCKDSCPCHGDANFCEKFCGCDPDWCGNRFQGCQCKCGVNFNKRCSTRQCPCLAAGRECDPDLCRLCIPTLTNSNEPGYQCNNFRLRLRQKRRVLMGLSDVQGWGAFLAGPAVKKDEFIGEYCGELIDQLEADHRGKVYDRDDNSYLFDLNQQWVIDARQKGNKLRFANHSTTANCRAEILMVDGDHRVAILANKDLVPGEELFYDYRYDKRVAPDWAQHTGGRGGGRGGNGGGGDGNGGSGRGRGRGRGR
jgi:hypothetical protein